MRVDPMTLRKLLDQASFSMNGDGMERQFGWLMATSFPNCERFWRLFIVPATRRVDGYPRQLLNDIRLKETVDRHLQDIFAIHYSTFVNLIYAHMHLQTRGLSWIVDFYVHLGSTCDLVEALLEKWYILSLTCRDEKSRTLQNLSRDEFLQFAGEWYDERYQSLYEYYWSKGKPPPFKIRLQKTILEEYLETSDVWGNYKRFSRPIREFRNRMVHDVQVGGLIIGSEIFVPKPAKISTYPSWREVFAAADRLETIQRDFAQAQSQACSDIQELETILNELWGKHLIQEFQDEFQSTERRTLRDMYGLIFEDGQV